VLHRFASGMAKATFINEREGDLIGAGDELARVAAAAPNNSEAISIRREYKRHADSCRRHSRAIGVPRSWIR
jgi:hypothetical protein